MKKIVVLFLLIAAGGVYAQQDAAPDGFVYGASSTRSGRRGYTTTDSRFNDIGFRLARSL